MRRYNLRVMAMGLLLSAAMVFGSMAVMAGAPEAEEVTEETDYTWTVMIYVCGDNNLEPYALMDLDEMELAGSSDDVTVVTLVDTFELIEGTHWYVIEDDGTDHIDAETGEHWCDCKEVTGEDCVPGTSTELDMGDGEVLTDFIVQAVKYAPADKYMLILWDHGGGWRGVCYDDSSPAEGTDGWVSRLTVPETADAIRAAADVITDEEDPIDSDYMLTILGYDACLMGMAEVLYENRDIADYMFASITLVSVLGQDYEGILNGMTAEDQPTVEEVGKIVVDSFADFYENYVPTGNGIEGWGDQSMSFFKLGAGVETLKVNVDNLAHELLNGGYLETNRGAIESAESQTPKIESSKGEQLPFIDLGLFAEKLGEKIPDLNDKFAEPVRQAVDDVVLYERHVTAQGGAIMNTMGMTIYFTCCYNWINPAYQFETLEEAELYAEELGLNTLYYGLEFVVYTWWDEFVFTFTQAIDETMLWPDGAIPY